MAGHLQHNRGVVLDHMLYKYLCTYDLRVAFFSANIASIIICIPTLHIYIYTRYNIYLLLHNKTADIGFKDELSIGAFCIRIDSLQDARKS